MRISNFLKELIISVLIFLGVLYGLPKILSLALNSSYPVAAVSSNSMRPVLKKGDLIFVKGVEKEDIRVGDIVIYRVGENFIVHRVVKLEEGQLVTKGDANAIEDTPVSYDQVVGRLAKIGEKPFTVPYLGNITAFANR